MLQDKSCSVCWRDCQPSPTAISCWWTLWLTGRGLQGLMDIVFDAAMLICDIWLICCRFNEWGLACWNVQKDRLLERSSHPCHWHYLAVMRSEDDGDFSQKLPSQISAQILAAPCLCRCPISIYQCFEAEEPC